MSHISNMEQFEKQITSFYRPTVMIGCSPDVNRILSKNLLNITSILTPFTNDMKLCNFPNNSLIMKPVNNDSSFDYTLKNFGIKLVSIENIKEYNINSLSNNTEIKLENTLLIESGIYDY